MWVFPEVFHIPLDKWLDSAVLWLTVHGEAFFDALGDALLAPLLGLERLLLWIPWFVIILLFAAGALKLRSWKMAVGIVVGMVFIGALGLWTQAMKTLAIVITATLLAIAVGVPMGILMSHSDRVKRVLQPTLDMMQTMPSFVYLIPALMFFGLGKVPALIATFIYAVPPVIRLTDLGIRQVAADVIEASKAFGSTSWQLLTKVQLPLAAPTIMTGVNQTIMMALAMVVIASMIGAGGLGSEVLNGIARLEVGRGFNGGISIVILAIIIDRLTQSLAKPRKAR
ncbi:MAG: proline/glycine betaine ABC transporter permease [Chloroflexi bacterium]|nr:proline/glycine betaine ABC transporter permease [Chloroflexota bacterium]